MHDVEVMKTQEYLYYSHRTRGAVMQLEEGAKLQFGTNPPLYLASIRINKRDLDGNIIPDEQGVRKMKLLEQTNAFLQGAIKYIASPEEVLREKKREEQKQNLVKMRDDLSGGLYSIDLENTTKENLLKLCDRIGVDAHNKIGKSLPDNRLKERIIEKIDLPQIKLTEKKDTSNKGVKRWQQPLAAGKP